MTRLRLPFVAILILSNTVLVAQTFEFQGTVSLRSLARVYKNVIVQNCPQTYIPPAGTSGTVITQETRYTNGKTEITVKDIVKPKGSPPFTINTNQVFKKIMAPNSNGRANLFLDENDKSVLYVSYWSHAKNMVPGGTTIQEFYPLYNCAGVPTMTQRTSRTLTNNELFYRQKVNPGSAATATQWFSNSEQIHVLSASGGLDYYLVDKYDRNSKFILELQNRESISYNSPSLDLGAMTIPIKYRFGFERNGIEIEDDVAASFNIGIYAGYKLTPYTIINKSGNYSNRTVFSLRIGPFLNLATTTLDSLNTTAGKIPKMRDDKQNIAILSPGIGLMADVKGIHIGIYSGWDFGMGSEAVNWNYHKRFWVGFGVGYKITDLFAKKEQ